MNDILNKLRERQPAPTKPEELTSRIMKSLEYDEKKARPFLQIQINARAWRAFAGFRTALAAAALFLAGYFIYQQFEIDERLNMIEVNMNASLSYPDNYRQTSRSARLEALYKAQFVSGSNNAKESEKEIVINRKTLNFFLSTIQKLEKENTSLRDIIKKQIADSARFNKSFQ
jgi:hypothetical protein